MSDEPIHAYVCSSIPEPFPEYGLYVGKIGVIVRVSPEERFGSCALLRFHENVGGLGYYGRFPVTCLSLVPRPPRSCPHPGVFNGVRCNECGADVPIGKLVAHINDEHR